MDTVEANKWMFWENEFPTAADSALQHEKMTVVDELNPELIQYIRDNGSKAAWQEWALKSPEAQAHLDIIFDVVGLSYK